MIVYIPRKLFSRIKKVTYIFLIALICITVYSAFSNNSSKEASASEKAKAVFTSVVCLDSEISKDNISAFAEFCNARKIKSVFFSNLDYASENGSLLEALLSEGHSLGIICENGSEMGKNDFSVYLAKYSNMFYTAVSHYPQYILFSGNTPDFAYDVSKSYGETIIKLSDENIINADIHNIGGVNDFAELYSKKSAKGYTYADMKDYIAECENAN